jgi:hypothetical protein
LHKFHRVRTRPANTEYFVVTNRPHVSLLFVVINVLVQLQPLLTKNSLYTTKKTKCTFFTGTEVVFPEPWWRAIEAGAVIGSALASASRRSTSTIPIPSQSALAIRSLRIPGWCPNCPDASSSECHTFHIFWWCADAQSIWTLSLSPASLAQPTSLSMGYSRILEIRQRSCAATTST